MAQSRNTAIQELETVTITRADGWWCLILGSHRIPICAGGRPCWRDTASAVNVAAYVRDKANGAIKVQVIV